MRVLYFWEVVGGLTLQHRCNPYAGLLDQGLEEHDVHLDLGDYAFQREWLQAQRESHDVLHFNWLDRFYKADSPEAVLERFTTWSDNLAYARHLGYRLVWTLHNLYPHEPVFEHFDHLANLMMAQLADEVIAHCQFAARQVSELFHRSKRVHVIPHGNFIQPFPNEVTREEARRHLELPDDSFVFLYFGNAKLYKGIEGLMETFSQAQLTNSVLLLMMRNATKPEYGEQLKKLASNYSQVRVATSPFFPNDQFQYYLNAADTVVLPFTEVLTSGSAIQALSFGRPVILPRLGCLPELVDESSGILYDAAEEDGLMQALRQARQMDTVGAAEAAMRSAQRLSWDGIAASTAAAYRGQQVDGRSPD